MKKIVFIGTGKYGRVFCKINATAEKLTISGVEGPKANGDCTGACGQILDHLNITTFADGWSPELVERFRATWNRWHLNDLRAGCEHQRANWDTLEKLEVVYYGLTTAAMQLRDRALAKAARIGLSGVPEGFSDTERALATLDKWFAGIHEAPDADSPLSGCYEVKKRETKTAGWVYQKEHPKGLLCKPCEVCGYKYGSAWLKEEVPAEVLVFLASLPDSPVTAPWV